MGDWENNCWWSLTFSVWSWRHYPMQLASVVHLGFVRMVKRRMSVLPVCFSRLRNTVLLNISLSNSKVLHRWICYRHEFDLPALSLIATSKNIEERVIIVLLKTETISQIGTTK